MPVIITVLEDHPEYQIVEETWQRGPGEEDLPGYRGLRTVPKPGTRDANRGDIEGKARAAVAGNVNFLGVQSPNNAALLAQVRALTRQNNSLIRLLLDELDSVNGT